VPGQLLEVEKRLRETHRPRPYWVSVGSSGSWGGS
jgi:hypothetical protein